MTEGDLEEIVCHTPEGKVTSPGHRPPPRRSAFNSSGKQGLVSDLLLA